MKAIYIFITIIFLIFALLQLNDPDPYLWIPIYAYVCILYIMAIFEYRRIFLLYAGVAIYIILIAIWLPDLINWIKMGSPTITGSMHAETPYIELTREFFGLVLCLLAVLFLVFRAKKVTQ